MERYRSRTAHAITFAATIDSAQFPGPVDAGAEFSGIITKAGDQYVLQDASGTSYNIDRQDLVKSREGKKVRINGTLDSDRQESM